MLWARIDLDAIRHNVSTLKSITCNNALFMAVVKANGYGHGAVQTAAAALESGADRLGVARLHEACQLRHAGIDVPILIFGFVSPEDTAHLLENQLTPTACDLETARQFSHEALCHGKTLGIHIKVDTGMGRVGLLWDHAPDQVLAIAGLNGVRIDGIYTHFAAADMPDRSYTDLQVQRFEKILSDLDHRGVEYGLRHAANSAGIMAFDNAHYDMVRAGIGIYGLFPSPDMVRSIDLKPALALKARITSVRHVPRGFNVSYGMTFQTRRPTCIASVPIGYADGYSRLLSSRGIMLVKGQKAPVCGRVCMDQTLIDVGHIPGVRPGDEAVLIGHQQSEEISADHLASLTRTINYEIVTSLTSRVERRYSGTFSTMAPAT